MAAVVEVARELNAARMVSPIERVIIANCGLTVAQYLESKAAIDAKRRGG